MASPIARELSAIGIPGLRIVASQGERSLYTRDQAEIPRFMKDIMFRSLPEAVVQPLSAEAVAAVLRFASSRGLTVVPRGSASSPFGGSVPVLGGLVLDTSRMNRILEVDPRARTVTVEAGARWAEVDHELERHGLTLRTYPSSRFSTVAGWLSTGGMGINSLSEGHVRESVEMVELVTADGIVRRLCHEDPLFHAIFGSEGQLGVITAVKLRVRERPTFAKPHLLLFDELDAAIGFAVSLARSEVRPAHILYEGPGKFPYINRSIGGEHFRSAHAILVSIEGKESESAFQRFVADLRPFEEREYLARYLWSERFFPMKVRRFGPGMLGSEVVVALESLGRALTEAERLCRQLDIDPLFEVHFISGGEALLLCYFVTDQGNTIRYTLDAAKSMLLTSALLDLGAKPYSIGVWNNPFSGEVDRTRLAALRAAKHSLDPHGVMNAGKMFGLSGRLGGFFGALFSPAVIRPILSVAAVWSPLTSKLMRPAYRFAERRLRPKTRRELLRIADECAMCGACVSVCPAYLVVGDERVTARGKLLTLKEIARGADITKEHAHRMFLCMRCKACEQVCQSKLALVDAYELLERELEALYGKDLSEIERFVRYAESTPEYDRLIEQGLVLGAPKHGMGGGRTDV
ncbi:MAG: FAD-binding protein [Thermoplasmata archaeon]